MSREDRLGKPADEILNGYLDKKRFRYVGPYNPNLPEIEVYTLMLIPQKGTLLVGGILKKGFSSDIPVRDLNNFREIL